MHADFLSKLIKKYSQNVYFELMTKKSYQTLFALVNLTKYGTTRTTL